MLYGWLVDEQTTIRQILKRLNAGPWLPRSGRHAWSPSTVHHILADPIYVGTAYANRYPYVPAAKPRAQRGPHTGEATCRRLRPREQWIAISVPALVDQEMWDRAQAQLARNAALSFRNNARHSYLLRCLLTCEVCGLAMYGVTRPATATKPERQYDQCRGKDCVLSARTAAYLGLVPSERSTGAQVWRGSITKAGNPRARRVLIEGAWTYRYPARRSRPLQVRQESLPTVVRAIAWKAQLRLCARYRRLMAAGKRQTVVTTAIAREMAAFLWAIGHAVEPRPAA